MVAKSLVNSVASCAIMSGFSLVDFVEEWLMAEGIANQVATGASK